MSEQDKLNRIAKIKAGLLGVFGGITMLAPDGVEAKSKADHQIRVP